MCTPGLNRKIECTHQDPFLKLHIITTKKTKKNNNKQKTPRQKVNFSSTEFESSDSSGESNNKEKNSESTPKTLETADQLDTNTNKKTKSTKNAERAVSIGPDTTVRGRQTRSTK